MAIKGKIISNPATKQHILFLQTSKDTGGRLLEMESIYEPYSKEPPMHYHPCQEEYLKVIKGELTVKLEEGIRVLKAGDVLHVTKNMAHSVWNNSPNDTIINWQVLPALNTENMLETITGLATDNKTNRNGKPPFLQLAILANKYDGIFRLARPPFIVQRILFGFITPVAYLLGYAPQYNKYID
jgi:quercetin dioxygenase-like cupin family protein